MASCLFTLEEQCIQYLMDSHGTPQQWEDMCMAKTHFSIGPEPYTYCDPSIVIQCEMEQDATEFHRIGITSRVRLLGIPVFDGLVALTGKQLLVSVYLTGQMLSKSYTFKPLHLQSSEPIPESVYES